MLLGIGGFCASVGVFLAIHLSDGDIMNEHPITLSPDEVRRVLALEPGETMTLTRPFPNQPPSDYVLLDVHSPNGRYACAWTKGVPFFSISESPLGQPGDVLVYEHKWKPAVPARGFCPAWIDGYTARLTVVSVTPRLDGETWLIDAKVEKEK